MTRSARDLYVSALDVLLLGSAARVAVAQDWELLREVARLAQSDAPTVLAATDPALFQSLRAAVTRYHLAGWSNMTPERVDEVASDIGRTRKAGARMRHHDRTPEPPAAEAAAAKDLATIIHSLTPENRRLIAAIRDFKPASVSELSRLCQRSQPNVSRSLLMLKNAGLVTMTGGRPKKPVLAIREIVLDVSEISG